jgi:hypothetical protein
MRCLGKHNYVLVFYVVAASKQLCTQASLTTLDSVSLPARAQTRRLL